VRYWSGCLDVLLLESLDFAEERRAMAQSRSHADSWLSYSSHRLLKVRAPPDVVRKEEGSRAAQHRGWGGTVQRVDRMERQA
jgi:hypothetical protein